MTYVQGFLIPVREGKKDAYKKMAHEAAPIFQDHGAQRIVECWGEEVPKGDMTDMYRAVKAQKDEKIVFSWIDWESKSAFDTAHATIGQDERMQDPPDELPFDGTRMIYAGFDVLGETGISGKTGYIQGYIAPVQKDNRRAFADMCATMREVAFDSGALRAVDSWAEEIADGDVTDFKQAVIAKDNEAIAFGYIEWPSKEAFTQGSAKMREDSRMPAGPDMPMDGGRLIFGGFEILLDTSEN